MLGVVVLVFNKKINNTVQKRPSPAKFVLADPESDVASLKAGDMWSQVQDKILASPLKRKNFFSFDVNLEFRILHGLKTVNQHS